MDTPESIAAEHEVALIKDLDKVNKKLYDILLREVAKLTKGGKLTAENKALLSQLEGIIREALKESGYTKAMDSYFAGFPAVLQWTEDYYQKQGISLTPMLGDAKTYNEIQEKVINDLRGAGANKEIIKPLADLIRQGAFLGSSFQDAADSLKNVLIEKNLPTRYVEQITKGALMMYDGAIQDEIKVRTKATHFYYVASIIETSRPFCVHMKDKYGSGKISFKELEKDLNEYCPAGLPSQDVITYTTVSGEKKTAKKGSGMMENTFTYNFAKNAGGHEYGCRHRVQVIPGKG